MLVNSSPAINGSILKKAFFAISFMISLNLLNRFLTVPGKAYYRIVSVSYPRSTVKYFSAFVFSRVLS